MKLHNQIFLAMGLAVAAGLLLPEVVTHLKFIGDLFLGALKMIVGPLVFASVVVGMLSLGDVRHAGRMGGKTVVYFLSTTFMAVGVGLLMVNLIQPGVGVDLSQLGGDVKQIRATEIGVGAFLVELVTGIFMNPFAALAQGKVLSIIAFALLLGGVITTLGERGEPLRRFFESLNDALMGMVHVILFFTPAGVFALLGNIVAKSGVEIFAGLAKYALAVVAGLAVHGFLLLFLVLPLLGRIQAGHVAKGMRAAWAMAFSTASSSATLPLTMECARDNVGVPDRSVRFVLPLGATINMDGTALYESVAALFIAQAYGIHLGIGEQMIVFLTATTAAIGAAGIPEAGLVTMSLVLSSVGLPLEGIALILAVDRILDMCRTCVNVVGDSIGSVVVARLEGLPFHPPKGQGGHPGGNRPAPS
ncbi:MAG: dicarboxylate/amino acid:cation symporter [Nitrospirota bacterium]|nr:dicarboxylate/amino acid:cation symporter [Nitrospirota bacterium]